MFQRIVSLRVWSLFLLLALFLIPTATSAQNGAGEIDNCCYVDRVCTTDFDWVSGYWAFQNKECTVASHSQQPAAAENIDNCCFIDWLCTADEEWVSGYYAFQHNYCAAPSQWLGVWSQMRQPQRSNSNRPSQPEEEPLLKRQLEWVTITLFKLDPKPSTVLGSDGNPVHLHPNDPEYMCSLNPGSHWCDQQQ